MTSGAVRAREALKLHRLLKYDILREEGANLPDCYKKFYREWKYAKPLAVHYIPPPSKWIRVAETGEVKQLQDTPLPLKFPKESHFGIWGGEAIVKGFQKRARLSRKVPHFWIPNLKKSAVYSEILNKRMEVVLTERTIDLIMENHGFDNYLLKNKACDLQSTLALKLKQKMLHALFYKELYPDNPEKQEQIYDKYKHFLNGYTADDIEWYGLTIDEAIVKLDSIKRKNNKPFPLKHKFRKELIENLMIGKDAEVVPEEKIESHSWISKLNPFKKS